MVPFKDRFPATVRSPQGTSLVPFDNNPKLPAPALRPGGPITKTSGLSDLLDLIRPLIAGGVAQQGAKSLLGGPVAAGINAAAMAMKPTPMGAEPPLYVRGPNGMIPNTANPLVTQLMGGHGGGLTPTAATAAPVPLPQPRPVSLPMTRPPMAGVPVPLPRPRPNVPAPYDGNPFYYGPGSMNFGAEGPSGNTFGQGPGLLSALFGK